MVSPDTLRNRIDSSTNILSSVVWDKASQ